MDGWMVDKDPHEFKLNFGTQSLISDKPQPPPPSHSHHALAKLNPAFGDQDPRVSRPLTCYSLNLESCSAALHAW